MNTSELSLAIANFRAQALTSLFSSDAEPLTSFGDIMSQLQTGAGTTATASTYLNTSLRDPGAAFAMMTRINGLDATYKAQDHELSQMESFLPQVQSAAQQLGALAAADGNDATRARLQAFADQYNSWVQRFSPDVQPGGVLAGTQAAEVALYELEQSVTNVFVGAQDGFRGLADLGIAIDPATHKMSVDAAKLDGVLASDKAGAVDAVQGFAANFAASAGLLASTGNFVQNRLDNLDRVIGYIGDNIAGWRSEFGSGNPATPTGQVAQALKAYNATAGG